MVDTSEDIWQWHHYVLECYYHHLQSTVKYRRSLFTEEIEHLIVEVMGGYKKRYEIEVHTLGFDNNYVHVLW